MTELTKTISAVSLALSLYGTKADGLWALAGLACTFAIPFTLLAGWFDPRELSGDRVWTKPFKFSLALAIHFATFSVIAHLLPSEYLGRAGLSESAYASVFAGAAELAYISLQAGRGRHSHFNTQTGWETLAASLMGIGAIIVIFPAIFLGALVMLFPPPAWPLAVVFGTATGLLGGAALTLLTALRMGRLATRFADVRTESNRKMWLTGWSLDRADIRPSHFLATHMMQVVPLMSALLSEILPGGAALVLSVEVAGAWALLTLGCFRQTLKGQTLGEIIGATTKLDRNRQVSLAIPNRSQEK